MFTLTIAQAGESVRLVGAKDPDTKPETVPGLGGRLTAALARAGMSESELSRRIKASRSFVNNITHGRNDVSILSIAKIADVLGSSIDALVYGQERQLESMSLDRLTAELGRISAEISRRTAPGRAMPPVRARPTLLVSGLNDGGMRPKVRTRESGPLEEADDNRESSASLESHIDPELKEKS